MPENAKIQVHLDLDSSIEAYEKLKLKFLEMAEQVAKFNVALDAKNGEKWSPNQHPAEKMTNYLAQAAAHIWGEEWISKEWDYHYDLGQTIICIEARIGQKMCRYMFLGTDEFFIQGDQKEKFFDLLAAMCDRFATQMPVQYALLPRRRMRSLKAEDPLDLTLTFTNTTSPYQLLRHDGYLEQLDWYWDNTVPFPERLAWEGGFYSAKDFWFKNIQEGDSIQEYKVYQAKSNGFAVGGWIKGPLPFYQDDMSDSGRLMRSICPGLLEHVKYPCGCTNALGTEPKVASLHNAIIHLNDAFDHEGLEKEWTRDEIADWLESLDIDLTLKDNSNLKKEEL